jgi:hypothetical protein
MERMRIVWKCYRASRATSLPGSEGGGSPRSQWSWRRGVAKFNFSQTGNALLQGLNSRSLAALLNPGKRDRRLGVADLKS